MKRLKVPKARILVPLYIYPAPGAWAPLHKAITTHPKLDFTIVINPHNGPGSGVGPDENYAREIRRLNSYANIRTVGYVATGYAKREIAAVLQDVSAYSRWSKNATSGLGMHGIFFDETPSQYEPSSAQFLDTAHAAVRSEDGFGPQGLVINNPGTIPDILLLKGPDVTVVFEGEYDAYETHNIGQAIASLERRIPTGTEVACIMHSVPKAIAKWEMEETVQELRKVADSVFITELSADYYSSFGPSWKAFVDEMDG